MSIWRIHHYAAPRRPAAMRKHLLSAACCVLLSQAVHAATVTEARIVRPDGARHYLLATPDAPASGKRGLVILLHGHMGSAAQVLGQRGVASPLAQWLAIAEREQLLLIAPDGNLGGDRKSGWNDCRADAPTNPRSDDSGLVAALIALAVAEHDVDPARVYVMGMSNGGMMTLRLAGELGRKLAAVATVGAGVAAHSQCAPPGAPVSVLLIAGTGDPVVPYLGGAVGYTGLKGRGTVLGAVESAAVWRALDQLPSSADVTAVPHRAASDPTRATRMLWGADPGRPQVELLTISQGGHVEPSIARRLGWMLTKLLGPQNGDVEAAEEAWNFFRDKRAAP